MRLMAVPLQCLSHCHTNNLFLQHQAEAAFLRKDGGEFEQVLQGPPCLSCRAHGDAAQESWKKWDGLWELADTLCTGGLCQAGSEAP